MPPPKIFLSYARTDQEFALKLARDLLDAGGELFVDQFDIKGGSDWDKAVEFALAGCQTFVVLLSPNAVKSENVLNEVQVALHKGKRVIPVLYRECEIPLVLVRKQRVNLVENYDIGFAQLRDDLGLDTPASMGGPRNPSLNAAELTQLKEKERDVKSQSVVRAEVKPMLAMWKLVMIAVLGIAGWLVWLGYSRFSRERTLITRSPSNVAERSAPTRRTAEFDPGAGTPQDQDWLDVYGFQSPDCGKLVTDNGPAWEVSRGGCAYASHASSAGEEVGRLFDGDWRFVANVRMVSGRGIYVGAETRTHTYLLELQRGSTSLQIRIHPENAFNTLNGVDADAFHLIELRYDSESESVDIYVDDKSGDSWHVPEMTDWAGAGPTGDFKGWYFGNGTRQFPGTGRYRRVELFTSR